MAMNINWRFSIPEVRVKQNNLGEGLAGLGQGLQTAANAMIASNQRKIAEEDRQRRIAEEERLKAIDEEMAQLMEQQANAPKQIESMTNEKNQKLLALTNEENSLKQQLQGLKQRLEQAQNRTFQAQTTNNIQSQGYTSEGVNDGSL
jgi:molecular chaperone DnaK (HSP70)